jgi:hypothetical protein
MRLSNHFGHTCFDGLVEVNPDGRHPIYDLIQHAEAEWDEKLRQSKALDEAVEEYTADTGEHLREASTNGAIYNIVFTSYLTQKEKVALFPTAQRSIS